MRLKAAKRELRIYCTILASVAVLLLSLPMTLRAASGGDEFSLSIVHLDYDPAERVAKFGFKISGGQVVGLSPVPIGWTIIISNDPSWSSEISGTAAVGAVFMQPQQFAKEVIAIRTMPDELKKYPGAPQVTRVTGYVDLYKTDATRRATLANVDFAWSRRQ